MVTRESSRELYVFICSLQITNWCIVAIPDSLEFFLEAALLDDETHTIILRIRPPCRDFCRNSQSNIGKTLHKLKRTLTSI